MGYGQDAGGLDFKANQEYRVTVDDLKGAMRLKVTNRWSGSRILAQEGCVRVHGDRQTVIHSTITRPSYACARSSSEFWARVLARGWCLS